MATHTEAILEALEIGYAVPFDVPVDCPDRLYHYTSASGLYGILTTGILRAGNFSYLNDASEATYGSGVVRSAVQSYANTKFVDLAEALLDEVDASLELYLSCFCAESDLLSQWRGYGDSAGRYCIAFDARRLVRAMSRLKCELNRVIYDREEQISKVRAVIEPSLKALKRSSRLTSIDRKQCEKAIYIRMTERLLDVLCFFKHHGFREEKAWRAVHQLDQNISTFVSSRAVG